jgi:dTMP kinase
VSLFVTLEGVEGCGKSTQARLLYEYLYSCGYRVMLVREPGGTRIGDMIRQVVLDLRNTEMVPTTETLLFSAARAQLVREVIRPVLASGGIVLCDRYADSTYAYQGYGLGRPIEELEVLTRIATGGLMPHTTIFLELSAEDGLARKQRRPGTRVAGITPPEDQRTEVEWNRLDARELAFHQRVASGYRTLIDREPGRWQIFDARQSIDVLAEQIRNAITPLVERAVSVDR